MSQPAANLTTGPIASRLLRMTGPMVVGIMANMFFNLVDTYFVGKLGGRALTAMSFTFPVAFFVTGTAMGMGIGVSSVVSRAIGAGNHKQVRRLATDGLLLALILVLVFAGSGLLFMNSIFRQLGAAPDLIPMIRSYMVPWFCGVGFLVFPLVGNSAIRATGDTLVPSMIMLTAGGLNVILDPLLIFGIGPFPRMELAGAALATVISYVVVFCGSFFLLTSKYKLISWRRPRCADVLASWKETLFIGLPAIATNQMVPIANGVFTRIASGYGEHAVAAWGVGSRVESLMMSMCFAMSTAMAPFTGQNFGAGNCDRVRSALRFAACYCFGISFVLWPLVALNGDWVASLFTTEPETTRIIREFLWIVPASYGAFGMMLQLTASFNSNRRPGESFAVFTSRLLIFGIPLALLGSQLYGLTGMFIGIGAANVIGFLVADQLMRRMLRKHECN